MCSHPFWRLILKYLKLLSFRNSFFGFILIFFIQASFYFHCQTQMLKKISKNHNVSWMWKSVTTCCFILFFKRQKNTVNYETNKSCFENWNCILYFSVSCCVLPMLLSSLSVFELFKWSWRSNMGILVNETLPVYFILKRIFLIFKYFYCPFSATDQSRWR